jgi:hypothetical protein
VPNLVADVCPHLDIAAILQPNLQQSLLGAKADPSPDD